MAKILLIDDDQLMQNLYKTGFRLAKHEPLVADSGRKGIAVAKTDHPDLILLDIMMPEMSGLEVLDALKKDNETKYIPVIIFTNLMSIKEQEDALTLGAVAYLIKSEHTPQDIVAIVEDTLKRMHPTMG